MQETECGENIVQSGSKNNFDVLWGKYTLLYVCVSECDESISRVVDECKNLRERENYCKLECV